MNQFKDYKVWRQNAKGERKFFCDYLSFIENKLGKKQLPFWYRGMWYTLTED